MPYVKFIMMYKRVFLYQHIEVIFINLDEPIVAHFQPKQGLGTLVLQLFSNVEYENELEFELPAKEYPPAMTFE